MHAERDRLLQARSKTSHWRRWGPYLSERSWGNPREDYSADGTAWDYFTHDHARSRAYRWTEDGIAGICDNHQRLCFAFAFWNGRDPILKERLFGVSGPEGNHGEDVKEYYYYLDSTPTHSYMKCAVQISAVAVSVFAIWWTTNRAAVAVGERIRADRHRNLRREPLFRHLHRIRQERRRRHSGARHHHQPRPVAGDAASAADRLVPQYLELGLRQAAAGVVALRHPHHRHPGAVAGRVQAVAGRCAAAAVHRKRKQHACACGATTAGNAYNKDSFHRYLIQGEQRCGESRRNGHQGLRRVSHRSGARRIQSAALPLVLRQTRPQPDFHQVFLDRIEEADDFYSFAPRQLVRRRAHGAAPGLRRPAVEQAVLSLRGGSSG